MSAREIVRDGLGRVADMPVAKARVARLCLPGPMWYLAVCESCRWAGLSWKHRVWAEGERDRHNERKHATPFVYPEGAPQ